MGRQQAFATVRKRCFISALAAIRPQREVIAIRTQNGPLERCAGVQGYPPTRYSAAIRPGRLDTPHGANPTIDNLAIIVANRRLVGKSLELHRLQAGP
jgi:hypothetical protein